MSEARRRSGFDDGGHNDFYGGAPHGRNFQDERGPRASHAETYRGEGDGHRVLVVEYPCELKSGPTDIPPEAAAITMPEDSCSCWWFVDREGFKRGPMTFASLKNDYANKHFKAEDRLVLYNHSDPSANPWTTFNQESRRRVQVSGSQGQPPLPPHHDFTPPPPPTSAGAAPQRKRRTRWDETVDPVEAAVRQAQHKVAVKLGLVGVGSAPADAEIKPPEPTGPPQCDARAARIMACVEEVSTPADGRLPWQVGGPDNLTLEEMQEIVLNAPIAGRAHGPGIKEKLPGEGGGDGGLPLPKPVLAAATVAVGNRAQWVAPRGFIIEGGADGRGMPMPGARGGWHLRGCDMTYMWRLAKDPYLQTTAEGAGGRLYHIHVGGGAKVGVAAAAELPCDPRPPASTAPPPPPPSARASFCATLPQPPFAGGPETCGADPVLPYQYAAVAHKHQQSIRLGSDTPSWSAVPGNDGEEDDATSGPAARRDAEDDDAPLPPDGATVEPYGLRHDASSPYAPAVMHPDGGEWFYFSHMGHKHGPFDLSELQQAVEHRLIPELHEGMSVVREADDRWRLLELPGARAADYVADDATVAAAAARDSALAEVRGKLHLGVVKGLKRLLNSTVEAALRGEKVDGLVGEVKAAPRRSAVLARPPPPPLVPPPIPSYIANASLKAQGSGAVETVANGILNEAAPGRRPAAELGTAAAASATVSTSAVMAEVDSLPVRPTSIDAEQLAAAAVGLLPADLLKEVAKWLHGDVAAFVRMGATCRLYRQVVRFVLPRIQRADLSPLGTAATGAALAAVRAQVGTKQGAGAVKVLCLRGCTRLSVATVRRHVLSGLAPSAVAALKLDVRDCPALSSLAAEMPSQCAEGVRSSDKIGDKCDKVYGALARRAAAAHTRAMEAAAAVAAELEAEAAKEAKKTAKLAREAAKARKEAEKEAAKETAAKERSKGEKRGRGRGKQAEEGDDEEDAEAMAEAVAEVGAKAQGRARGRAKAEAADGRAKGRGSRKPSVAEQEAADVLAAIALGALGGAPEPEEPEAEEAMERAASEERAVSGEEVLEPMEQEVKEVVVETPLRSARGGRGGRGGKGRGRGGRGRRDNKANAEATEQAADKSEQSELPPKSAPRGGRKRGAAKVPRVEEAAGAAEEEEEQEEAEAEAEAEAEVVQTTPLAKPARGGRKRAAPAPATNRKSAENPKVSKSAAAARKGRGAAAKAASVPEAEAEDGQDVQGEVSPPPPAAAAASARGRKRVGPNAAVAVEVTDEPPAKKPRARKRK